MKPLFVLILVNYQSPSLHSSQATACGIGATVGWTVPPLWLPLPLEWMLLPMGTSALSERMSIKIGDIKLISLLTVKVLSSCPAKSGGGWLRNSRPSLRSSVVVSKTCELSGWRGGLATLALSPADFVEPQAFPSSRRRTASMSRHFTVGAGLGADFYNHFISEIL